MTPKQLCSGELAENVIDDLLQEERSFRDLLIPYILPPLPATLSEEMAGKLSCGVFRSSCLHDF